MYNVSIRVYSCLFFLRVYNASSAYQGNQYFQKQIINTCQQIEIHCFTMVSGHDYRHYPVSTRGGCGRLPLGMDGSGRVWTAPGVWTAPRGCGRLVAPRPRSRVLGSCLGAGFMFGCWVHVWRVCWVHVNPYCHVAIPLHNNDGALVVMLEPVGRVQGSCWMVCRSIFSWF